MDISDIFGNGWDDPKSQTMLSLAAGLMRGGLPGAIDGINAAQDAQMRRRVMESQLQNSALGAERARFELDSMRAGQQRARTIQEQLAALEVPKSTPLTAGGPDALGVPNVGGVPMFSQIGQAGASPVRAPLSRPTGGLPAPVGGQQSPSVGGLLSSVPVGGLLSQPSIGGLLAPPPSGQQAPQPGGLLSPASGSYTQGLMNRLVQQAQVYARNGDFETSNKLLESATKWMPQVHSMEVGMRDGQPVNVVTFKDGTQQVSAFAPEPKTHFLDTGGGILPLDERTNQPRGPAFPKSMTPGERASNAIAAGNLQVSRDRLALDQTAPQYMQTDQGVVALPKRPGAGPIQATPVTNPDGSAISAPLKQIPASANTAIQSNLQNLRRAQDALALVQGRNVGTSTGDRNATGWKGYLPNSVLNRVDPAGVDARAAIADLGSLTIHDRSGAAVTAAEFPRLAPFVPQPTDDAATVEKKLQRFVQVYQQEVEAQGQTYGRDQGYRPNPLLERRASSPRTMPEAMPLPSVLSAENMRRGQAYQLPNGEVGVWDGMRFKGQR